MILALCVEFLTNKIYRGNEEALTGCNCRTVFTVFTNKYNRKYNTHPMTVNCKGKRVGALGLFCFASLLQFVMNTDKKSEEERGRRQEWSLMPSTAMLPVRGTRVDRLG